MWTTSQLDSEPLPFENLERLKSIFPWARKQRLVRPSERLMNGTMSSNWIQPETRTRNSLPDNNANNRGGQSTALKAKSNIQYNGCCERQRDSERAAKPIIVCIVHPEIKFSNVHFECYVYLFLITATRQVHEWLSLEFGLGHSGLQGHKENKYSHTGASSV